MKKFNSKTTRKYDYPIFCEICNDAHWFSETYELEDETGKGGLFVCPRDRDAIDYGLVPYTVEAEVPPKVVIVDSNQVGPLNQYVLPVENLNPYGETNWVNMNWEDVDANWEDIDNIWNQE